MLVQYIGEYTVSIINVNHDIQVPTCGYQSCNTSQITVLNGDAKMRDSLYARVIVWVNTILKDIDTRAILPRYESSCIVNKPK